MAGLKCDKEDCSFVSIDGSNSEKLQHLQLHIDTAHTNAPVLAMQRNNHCSLKDWEFFKFKWQRYKSIMGITEDKAAMALFDCLPENVEKLVHGVYGVELKSQSEKAIILTVEKLVVLRNFSPDWKIVIEMFHLNQMKKEESGEEFVKRIKKLAKQTKFLKTIKCTNCGGADGFNNDVKVDFSEEIVLCIFLAGLADPEIQRELVKKEDLTLAMAVQYTTDHERAKQLAMEVKKEDTPEIKSENYNIEYVEDISLDVYIKPDPEDKVFLDQTNGSIEGDMSKNVELTQPTASTSSDQNKISDNIGDNSHSLTSTAALGHTNEIIDKQATDVVAIEGKIQEKENIELTQPTESTSSDKNKISDNISENTSTAALEHTNEIIDKQATPVAIESEIQAKENVELTQPTDQNKISDNIGDNTVSSPSIAALGHTNEVYKKYNIDLTGLLQYVTNQLKAKHSLDLLIVKGIVQKMGGIKDAEEMTEEQIDALSVDEILRLEAATFMQSRDSFVQLGTFLASNLSPDDYTSNLPSIEQLLTEFHFKIGLAFSLSRPTFNRLIKPKFKEMRKTDKQWKQRIAAEKQVKHAEAAQLVMEPITAAVIPLHPAEVWDDISSQFLTSFWSLTMYDLHVPEHLYEKEIKEAASKLDENKDLNTEKRKKGAERLNNRMEEKMHKEHVERVMVRLKQEKDGWFLSRAARSAKNDTITQFLQLCVFPRCMFTAIDAIYVAKFVSLIHMLKTPNFSTLICYDRVFCNVTDTVTCCTENEASRYGRFLSMMLDTVMRWHGDKEVFERECAGYPGFITKFRVTTVTDETDTLDYENYRHVCHKWQYTIAKALVDCLESKDFVQIHNSLIVLTKIIEEFPAIKNLSTVIEKRIEKVCEEEKDKRQDLYIMARSYQGQLQAEKSKMMTEEEFHDVHHIKLKRGADGKIRRTCPTPSILYREESREEGGRKRERDEHHDDTGPKRRRDEAEGRHVNGDSDR